MWPDFVKGLRGGDRNMYSCHEEWQRNGPPAQARACAPSVLAPMYLPLVWRLTRCSPALLRPPLADVRKLLAVTQGKEKAYAGTSNETPQGRAFLKKQLDGLMAEKAQYKEKKLALQQLQQELPNLQEDSEYHEPAAGEEGNDGFCM